MNEAVAPLLGAECAKCGSRVFSSTQVCRSCGSGLLAQVELPRTGRLITYTVIRYPPAPFVGEEPYAVGVIELDDGTR
ncbi:MAG: Zn-ribbon domain-containing OB-fold protein, partial [Candidatus Geothermarchaeales archaeon]